MKPTGAVIMPLKQTICKGLKHLYQFKGDKKGGRGGLRLQCIYRPYIQTDRLEKVKGWHSQSVEYGDARGLHGQMRFMNSVSSFMYRYKLKQRKMNSHVAPFSLTKFKTKQILSGVHDVAGGRDQSQCKCSSLRSRMGLGRACWLRIEDGSSSGERNSTRPRWLKRQKEG